MNATQTSATNHHQDSAPALETELAIGGMTCGNCARHVTDAILSVPGVDSASVRLGSGKATIRWQSPPDIPAVVTAVGAAGYEVKLVTNYSMVEWSPLTGWQFNVVVGLVCTVPLMLGEWAFGLAMQPWFRWCAFALALPVQVFCGASFYISAWRQLKIGSSNMDTLVSLGSLTAFGYSTWGLFSGAPGHLYFMEAAAIITLISLGHWVEARTSVKAESSLQALLRLAPAMARRLNSDGSETDVPVRELRVGESIVLKPGDHVPVDGLVSEGGSAVDESMLTGESLPVDKASGDKLYAGTANLNGRLIFRVTETGESTALAHIIAAVERAQNSRAEVRRLGDRVSSIFVPIVVLVALATGLWWGFAPAQAHQASAWLAKFLWPPILPATVLAAALIHAAAVLIVACPCAMGLATPIAIMAGTNAAARRGILVRDGIALERAGQITALVFDKTGTLTCGKPAVVAKQSCASSNRLTLDEMKLAAALARHSQHPVSQAVAKLDAGEFSLTDWQEVRGAGVQARLRLEAQPALLTVRLGSLRWLRESGVDVGPARSFEAEWSAKRSAILGIASDRQLLGLLAVEDALKPGARDVVAQLQRDGLKIYLATGDNPLTARAIAREAGILPENVLAEARPEQKAKFIADLRAKGDRVAFVGDGINDAPALESADLGIAVSQASDVAREAADIILLKSEIQAVPQALDLARATLRTIKQNLFWAFFYNAAGIPLAALGFLSPILCALTMGFSDLVVIGNALRLLRRK